MNQQPDELATISARRSSTWWLLSRLVTEQPEDPWLSDLEGVLAAVDPDPAAPLSSESAQLLAALRAARTQADGMIALAVDRTRLLAGVLQGDGIPAPYETVALGDPMNTARVLDVAHAYAEAGFDDPAPELGPPDALGTELRFMALLCFREAEAHRDGDAGLAAAWVERQRRFMDEHLLAWVPAHCELLASKAVTPFYAAAAALLSRACNLDREDIDRLTELGRRTAAPEPAQ